ncbi:hypothetical protein OBBRIDRAFT_807107 [Obba rivulosa]|uniref:Uncharacterized protein n=1 Tax=Obba rivulosa TaxID=1052685 RepID=A0A8E2AV79_9APHY|nr:hypothetical protein OBBRIDRAFT_807107 [Obba rivulosa]
MPHSAVYKEANTVCLINLADLPSLQGPSSDIEGGVQARICNNFYKDSKTPIGQQLSLNPLDELEEQELPGRHLPLPSCTKNKPLKDDNNIDVHLLKGKDEKKLEAKSRDWTANLNALGDVLPTSLGIQSLYVLGIISEPELKRTHTKVSHPLVYNRANNLEKFEVWLNGLLGHLSTLQLQSLHYNTNCVHILSQVLSGPTAMWYYINDYTCTATYIEARHLQDLIQALQKPQDPDESSQAEENVKKNSTTSLGPW